MKNNILNKKLNDSLKEKQWNDFISQSMNNPLLEKAKELPEYFRTYASAELIAVIPALEPSHEKSQIYYSASSLDDTLRLAPAFLFDNSNFLSLYKDELFELSESKRPNYMTKEFSDDGRNIFLFDSEAYNLHVYEKKGYTPSEFLPDMKKHIMANPFAVIFKGSDDGNVGMRFSSRLEAEKYLSSLTVFEDVFNSSDDMQKTLLKLKKENPTDDLSPLFKGNLEYHN